MHHIAPPLEPVGLDRDKVTWSGRQGRHGGATAVLRTVIGNNLAFGLTPTVPHVALSAAAEADTFFLHRRSAVARCCLFPAFKHSSSARARNWQHASPSGLNNCVSLLLRPQDSGCGVRGRCRRARVESSLAESDTVYMDTEATKHVSLSALLEKRRVIIVGDVHGCYDELCVLCEKVGYNELEDTLIFAGDLVNKGALAVVGNHELVCLRAHSMRARGLADASDGGKWGWLDDLSSDDIDYLKRLPYSVRLPLHGAMVVHAGVVPGKRGIASQNLLDLVTMRNVVPLRDLRHAPQPLRDLRDESSPLRDLGDESVAFRDAPLPLLRESAGVIESPEGGRSSSSRSRSSSSSNYYYISSNSSNNNIGLPWAQAWEGPEHIYFGHDARRGLQEHAYATGLDTGCVYGGSLTAAVLDGWQDPGVDSVSLLPLQPPPRARLVSVKARKKYVAPDK